MPPSESGVNEGGEGEFGESMVRMKLCLQTKSTNAETIYVKYKIQIGILRWDAAAYQLGNTSSRTITEVKQR